MKAESRRNREGAGVLLFRKPIAALGVFFWQVKVPPSPNGVCAVASRPAAGQAHGTGSSPPFWGGF